MMTVYSSTNCQLSTVPTVLVFLFLKEKKREIITSLRIVTMIEKNKSRPSDKIITKSYGCQDRKYLEVHLTKSYGGQGRKYV